MSFAFFVKEQYYMSSMTSIVKVKTDFEVYFLTKFTLVKNFVQDKQGQQFWLQFWNFNFIYV